MKIVNVTPGIIPIPSNGWGAIEKIIWENHKCLLEMGHESKICYLDEVDGTEDIVHIHVANLANIAHSRGIDYVFTFHDHHAYLYGKESSSYLENLQAIKHARIAFVPAKFLLDYFENPRNLFYFSHGVNELSFRKSNFTGVHSVLCVANNGFAYDRSEDRKGFGFAIEAAKQLGLPITVCGPSNNKNFFERHPQDYDKLEIRYDLTEDELRDVYAEHTLFLHPSVLEAGHPNLTILEAMSSGLPVVATFEENNNLEGLIRIERDIQSVISGINEAISHYEKYSNLSIQTASRLDWKSRVAELISYYKKSNDMKDELINSYENLEILNLNVRKVHPKFNYNFMNGAFFEILGNPQTRYAIEFIDSKTNECIYRTDMNGNCWAKCSREYYTEWLIRADDGEDQYEYYFDLNDKRVLINFESSSLGDTFAWVPIIEEFRKRYQCHVVVSTFHNNLFKEKYPSIEFCEPGTGIDNLYASYSLGYFYNENGEDASKHPINPFTRPLQATASDILGLEHIEIRPEVSIEDSPPEIEGKYICIAPHSTAQAKYWNFPGGWQKVIDYYTAFGYKVVCVSQEDPDADWAIQRTGKLSNIIKRNGLTLETVLNDIKHCDVFVGISSGLTWAAWGLQKPIVLISGFTSPSLEFTECERVIEESVCNGCWSRTLFDKGDWMWCPDHKGTVRHFECTKAITPDSVIRAIDRQLNR